MQVDIPSWAQEPAAALLRDLAEDERAECRTLRADLLDALAAQVELAIRQRELVRMRKRRQRARQRGESVPLRRPGPVPREIVTELDELPAAM